MCWDIIIANLERDRPQPNLLTFHRSGASLRSEEVTNVKKK
jgi:hypothetical protein